MMSEKDEASEDWDTLIDALGLARSGEYMVALSRIESVLSRRPNYAEALMFKGNAIELKILDMETDRISGPVRSPEMKKARVCYEKALLLQPNNVMILADLGTHYRYIGNDEEAIKYYDKVIKMGNQADDVQAAYSYVEALEGKIRILEERGEKDDALQLKQLLPPGD